MSRILLADDSPHAQRMGERILREEGYEVVTVTDGNTAISRLADVDPDVVFADISLPLRSGYDICRTVKTTPRHSHVRVVLTAGLLEPFDEAQAKEVRCDGVLKKPFESSVVLETIKPLLEAAQKDRLNTTQPAMPVPVKESGLTLVPNPPVGSAPAGSTPAAAPVAGAIPVTAVKPVTRVEPIADPATPVAPPAREHAVNPASSPSSAPVHKPRLPAPVTQAVPVRVVPEQPTNETLSGSGNLQADTERVRAAVTVALDAALPSLIDEITRKVLIALGH
jgi:CheY-like chemotaxis protein